MLYTKEYGTINMQCGYQLKYIATVALSLITFGFTHTLFALGLSDISVQSRLGEPLRATITIFGAPELKSESCLKLGSDSDLKPINFMLGPINGDTAKLAITSPNIVNEPIVNFSVIAGCDNSIERHYVLLLDPPASLAGFNAIQDKASLQITNDNINNTETNQTTQKSMADTNKAKEKTVKNAVKRQTTSTKQNKKSGAFNRASSNQQSRAETPETKPEYRPNNDTDVPENNKSRLSISGTSYTPSSNDTGLRLDKKLNLDPDAYASYVPVTAEDTLLEDEMTVVNNRISHLQKQVSQLQKQNLKLSSDNQLKTNQLVQTKSKQTKLFNLLLLIGAILLLILAYFIFSWLRRRQIEVQANHAQAFWVPSNKPSVESNTDQLEKAEEGESEDETEEEHADDDLLPAAPAGAFKPINEEQPIVVEDEQSFSVLDHADVFLFHGRASLAIQLLQNYLIEHPKQSVTIWLFLLDLLAKEDLKDLYEQTATDCKLHYNIKIPDLSESEKTETIDSLEDFPRLAQGLTQVWGTPSALVYLDDLIYNHRLTPRKGLPKNLIEELTLLKAIIQESISPADAPPPDEKKLAEIKEKEALLKKIKVAKLESIAKAEALAKEQEASAKKETSFEFTLIDK
jgi:hypothetical protein